MTQSVRPARFDIAMYRGPDGPRAGVPHEAGLLVDVALAAAALAAECRELRPFADRTDLADMLAAELDLDALARLATVSPEALPAGAVLELADARFEPPVRRPGKVIGVGLNVPGLVGSGVPRVEEMPHTAPFWFTKASTSVVGHGDEIVHPGEWHTTKMIPEPELAMIIGKRCGPGIASPRAEDAAAYIAGWSICDDVSAIDIEFERGGAPFAYNLTWGKSYPTFAPIGPWLTRLAPEQVTNLAVSMQVNGEPVCAYNTSELLWSPFELLEYFAAVVVLEPGDVISCGNAPPVRVVVPGDRVDIDIEKVGRLTNEVVGAVHPTSFRVPDKALEFARRYRENHAGAAQS